MKTILAQLKRKAKQVRGLLPSPLPQGVEEFHKWCDDIKATYTLPTDREADIKGCFSAVIMRFNEITQSKPKYYFVKALRSGAAKQVASYAFTEIKHKQAAAQAAEAAKLEATSTQVVADESPK